MAVLPRSGAPGEGNETTLNVPLGAGAGDDEIVNATEQVVLPALMAFAPDLLLVSAGFDAAAGDPLGGLEVTAEGFAALTGLTLTVCERVAFVLEGGYNTQTLPGSWAQSSPPPEMDVTTDTFEADVIEQSKPSPSSSTSGPTGAARARR